MKLSQRDVEFLHRTTAHKQVIIALVALFSTTVIFTIVAFIYFQKANAWAEVAGRHPAEVFWHGFEKIDRNEEYPGSYLISTLLFENAMRTATVALFMAIGFVSVAVIRNKQRRRFDKILEALRTNNLIEPGEACNAEKPSDDERSS